MENAVNPSTAGSSEQIVIAGAGYDDRALRFRSPGVRFFEIDHPDTQADKARRLRAMGAVPGGPVLAPADFRHDDVAAVLRDCGHDAGQPTLFACEGLLVYLDQPACVRLLGALRARAAAGSMLAASLSVHRDGQDSARVTAAANARRRAADAEPWLTILPAAAHLELVARAGWQAAEVADAAQFGTGAEPGRSLLMTARPAAGR